MTLNSYLSIVTLTVKELSAPWKKLKKTQRNEKLFHAHGLEEQILLECQHYPKQSAHSVQSQSKLHWHSSQG